MVKKMEAPFLSVCLVYLICFAFRSVEYFGLRTDQGVIGEAFVHKLLGIAVLAVACKCLHFSHGDIGFSRKRAAKCLFFGLLLGTAVFAAAYGVELLVIGASGQSPQLRVFVTSYTIQGNRAMQGSAFYVFVCLLGNLINVVMEEGVFRGLFHRLLENKYGFVKSCLLSSLLFGIWHITQPLRNWPDGEQSLAGAGMSALLLVVTSMLMGIQLCLLMKLTGSLWAGMGAHFVNNTVVNLLHVSAGAEYDALQALRITIAQTLSFVIVLALFVRRKAIRQAMVRSI